MYAAHTNTRYAAQSTIVAMPSTSAERSGTFEKSKNALPKTEMRWRKLYVGAPAARADARHGTPRRRPPGPGRGTARPPAPSRPTATARDRAGFARAADAPRPAPRRPTA